MGKPHLSHSQIQMLAGCGEQYRRRYVEGHKIPPGIALLVGTGTHVGAEVNFEQKIESHVDLPASQIVEAAVAGFEDDLETRGIELSAEEKFIGKDKVIGTAKDQVVALAGLYAAEQAPDYQPVAIEQEILIPMPAASHDLLGYIDLIDDKERLTDFKTSGKSKPQTEADNSTQLTIYSAAYQIKTGHQPKEIRLDIAVKTKKPKRQVLVTSRSQRDIDALVNRINTALRVIEVGVFMPIAPGSWQCSPRFCGYFMNGCPYVNPERIALAEINDRG